MTQAYGIVCVVVVLFVLIKLIELGIKHHDDVHGPRPR